jgi:transposase
MARESNAKKQKAEEWFIENIDATQKEVAELFGISEKTIGTWVKKHNWMDKRLDYHSSPVKIKELLQRELLSVAQGNTPKLSADGISKLMSALDRCDKKADPIVVQRILKDLDNFISEIDPSFAVKCTQFHKQFLIHRINLEA